MKLTVLIDNNTIIDRYFLAEPGLSFLVETKEKKILFDVGYSDAFIQNAWRMKKNLLDIDHLVLSHGHLDHTWGLDPYIRLFTEAEIENIPYKRPVLTAHPSVLQTKTLEGLKEIGSLISEEKMSKHFTMNLSKEPVWLDEKLVFLGQIERNNDFEAQQPLGKCLTGTEFVDDYLWDDTAIAYKAEKGLVVITGCSHAGICNIVEHAKKVCNEERIVDIVGGFHLLNPPGKQLEGTINYLKQINPSQVHACHCTDFPSKAALARVLNLQEVGVGLVLEYN